MDTENNNPFGSDSVNPNIFNNMEVPSSTPPLPESPQNSSSVQPPVQPPMQSFQQAPQQPGQQYQQPGQQYQPYQQPYQYQEVMYQKQGESGLGIASLVTAVLGVLVHLSMYVLVFAAVASTGDAESISEEDPAAMMIGFAFLGSIGLFIISALLGIASFFQSRHKNLCGMIGLVISLAFTFCGCGLMALGLIAG